MPAPSDRQATLGGILAGGRARRMGGGDKGLRQVGGSTVLRRVVQRMAPQVTRLVLNANGDPARFADLHLPVVEDDLPGRLGPLAGILALLDWAATHAPETEWVATVAADAPFLPRDLVPRLHDARTTHKSVLASAASGGRTHWVIGLWPVGLRHELRDALTRDALREVGGFVGRYASAVAEWPIEPVDPFFNVNTPDDLAAAETLAAAHPDL
jgi:molybdopterin-guanine dinucleotide biosynthesis protein A